MVCCMRKFYRLLIPSWSMICLYGSVSWCSLPNDDSITSHDFS